jgi:TP901-1 family phage major tail protein
LVFKTEPKAKVLRGEASVTQHRLVLNRFSNRKRIFMTAQAAHNVLIKIGDGLFPETFTTVGGLQVTELGLRNQPQESTNISSAGWRELLAGAGTRSIRISGEGIFVDSSAEASVRALAFSAGVKNFKLTFGNGSAVVGAFMVSDYERRAEVDGEERYALTLESAGVVTFMV